MLGEGAFVGPYRVGRLLGEGGMAAVYEATHDLIGRRVAIKVLHPDLAEHPTLVSRFLNEARAANLVTHPGLVEVYEIGALDDGRPYIVMELLRGETLSARLRRGQRGLAEVLRIGRELALALCAAHAEGVVHRDLKPDNVMLVRDRETSSSLGDREPPRVKVLDFGVAKLLGATATRWARADRTRAGVAVGTPAYMAPEQCEGTDEVGVRADVYASGVMLYELLAGSRPFDDPSPIELMRKQLRAAPPPLRDRVPRAPEPLVALVHRMLSKRAVDRPSMDDVARTLAEVEAGAEDIALPDATRRESGERARSSISRPGAPTVNSSAPLADTAPPPARVSRRWVPMTVVGAAGVALLIAWGRAAEAPDPLHAPALPARPALPALIETHSSAAASAEPSPVIAPASPAVSGTRRSSLRRVARAAPPANPTPLPAAARPSDPVLPVPADRATAAPPIPSPPAGEAPDPMPIRFRDKPSGTP